MEQIIIHQRARARFERIFTALLAIMSGVILILLAVQGPLFLDHIHYKTAEVINNQLLGQDIINLLVLAPLLIAGGISLLLKKRYAIYLLLMAPLYLIYYVLSYTIGWEWSSTLYTGNNEKWFFHFLFILISSVIILFYSLAEFPEKVQSHFKRKHLLKNDPTFLFRDLSVFLILGAIISFGFGFILKNYRTT